MAKAGDITAAGTSEAIKAAVLGDLTPNLTLGAVAAAALGGSDDPLRIVVNTANRTVTVYIGTGTPTAEDGDGDFSIDDTTKKVAPWTGVTGTNGDGFSLLSLANNTSKPSRSLASLISVIEDALTAVAQPGLVIIDQVAQLVRVRAGDGNSADAFDGAEPTKLATLTQVIPTSDGHVKGPFE